jgi:hypothetical protein
MSTNQLMCSRNKPKEYCVALPKNYQDTRFACQGFVPEKKGAQLFGK